MKRPLEYLTCVLRAMAVLCVFCIALSTLAAEAEHPLITLQRQLPHLPDMPAQPSPLPADLQGIIPGLRVEKQQRIYFDGAMIFDQGPKDGLEVLACMPGGKNHESMLGIDCGNGALIKSLFIAHLGLHDGQPSPQDSGIPARGYPVCVMLRWRPDPVLEPDAWVERDVSTMIRDRVSGQPYPPLPYIYTGSRFQRQLMPDQSGVDAEKEVFMLDVTKTLIANYDEADALLESPFALAQFDSLFEVNSADAPTAVDGNRVQLYCAAATLDLSIDMDATGRLSYQGKALDVAGLQALLRMYFGIEKSPRFRALGLRTAPATPHSVDVNVREYVLTQAVAVQAWVMPIFVLAAD